MSCAYGAFYVVIDRDQEVIGRSAIETARVETCGKILPRMDTTFFCRRVTSTQATTCQLHPPRAVCMVRLVWQSIQTGRL